MSYEKEIDHFVTESGEVMGLKDPKAREILPFANMKATLIVDMKIPKDENGNLPERVEITQRDDGSPLALKAFIIGSDVKSGFSYTNVGINDLPWTVALPLSHGNLDQTSTFVIVEDGGYFGVNTVVYPVGYRKANSGVIPSIKQIDKFTFPCQGQKLASGTIIRIYEITGG